MQSHNVSRNETIDERMRTYNGRAARAAMELAPDEPAP